MPLRLLFLCLLTLLLLFACRPNLTRVLPGESQSWDLSRLTYEYILVNDRIDRLDTANFGRMEFASAGSARLYRFDVDTALLDTWEWQTSDNQEITLRFSQLSFGGEQTFTFEVLENQRKEQLWRAEKFLRVYSVLRRDSVDARILLQMSLDRHE
jgi:hypothetical protein